MQCCTSELWCTASSAHAGAGPGCVEQHRNQPDLAQMGLKGLVRQLHKSTILQAEAVCFPWQGAESTQDFAAWPSPGQVTEGHALWFKISHNITSCFSTVARGHFLSLFQETPPSACSLLENTLCTLCSDSVFPCG